MKLLSIFLILSLVLCPVIGADTVFSGPVGLKNLSVSSSGIERIQPVVHYKLNDDAANTTVSDSSVNGLDGTFSTNTADRSTSGKINDALSFNGLDWCGVTDNSLLDIRDKISISVWVTVDSLASSQESDTIISKRTGNRAPFILRRSGGANYNKIDFTYDTRDDSGEAASYVADSDTFTATGTYQHYVVTHTYGAGSNTKIYLNGSEIAATWSGTGNQIPVDNAANMTIGRLYSGSQGQNWNGDIDDVRIYNEILTQSQVDFLYNSGSGTEDEL